MRRLLLIVFLALIPPQSGCHQVAHAHNGKLHIVVIGDDYTAADEARFEAAAGRAINTVLDTEPFRSRPDVLDFKVLFSTADVGCKRSATTTRLITCNAAWAGQIISAAGMEYDHIFVLVKTSGYGGSGGNLSVSYDGDQLPGVITHEWGHWFGLFDEYLLSATNGPVDVFVRQNCGGQPPPADLADWTGATKPCRYQNWYRQKVLLANGARVSSVMYALTKYVNGGDGKARFQFTPAALAIIHRRLDQFAASG